MLSCFGAVCFLYLRRTIRCFFGFGPSEDPKFLLLRGAALGIVVWLLSSSSVDGVAETLGKFLLLETEKSANFHLLLPSLT